VKKEYTVFVRTFSSLFIILAILFGVAAVGFGYRLYHQGSGMESQSLHDGENQKDTLHVAVSILPQKIIVERIGGEFVDVRVLIKPGFSPATYDPTVEDISYISSADIYFRIGQIGFEKTHLQQLISSNPRLEIVDTSRDIQHRFLADHDHEDEHEDHEEGSENAQSLDPHVWLSPILVQQQASVIAQTLITLDPENTSTYQDNLADLHEELDELDRGLDAAFSTMRGKMMLVYHPAFGYLADRYGFIQEYFEIEGKEPTIQQLQGVIEKAKSNDVRVIFVQKQFSAKSAHALAEEINGTVVMIDPLAPDYFNNMREIARIVSAELN
jgi:zinc transport system substrate-binding protein